jgi:beta-galactosidase
MQHLKKRLVSELGEEAVLYTTDPPTVVPWGGLPDVFHAVDFGPRQWTALNFWIQSAVNCWGDKTQTAPFNSEFYTGWFTHWGTPVANTYVFFSMVAP